MRPTVQLTGREINAGQFVLGSHQASALVWISQSFTLLGLRRLDADSNFMRISTLPGTLRPKDPGGENRTHLCTRPIYKEPDKDGAAWGLGLSLAEAVRPPRCWSWGSALVPGKGCSHVRRARHTEVPPHILMMIMQQKPLYKQFIYSKQQHRQNAI